MLRFTIQTLKSLQGSSEIVAPNHRGTQSFASTVDRDRHSANQGEGQSLRRIAAPLGVGYVGGKPPQNGRWKALY